MNKTQTQTQKNTHMHKAIYEYKCIKIHNSVKRANSPVLAQPPADTVVAHTLIVSLHRPIHIPSICHLPFVLIFCAGCKYFFLIDCIQCETDLDARANNKLICCVPRQQQCEISLQDCLLNYRISHLHFCFSFRARKRI